MKIRFLPVALWTLAFLLMLASAAVAMSDLFSPLSGFLLLVSTMTAALFFAVKADRMDVKPK